MARLRLKPLALRPLELEEAGPPEPMALADLRQSPSESLETDLALHPTAAAQSAASRSPREADSCRY